MSYQALARKWRPQIFSDVVGQKHIITALSYSFTLNRIHHAYILSGTRGIGKTTIARLIAKGLNCNVGITDSPCGECNVCRDIEMGCFIDLIEIDAASRTKVEDTRELLENIQYTPVQGRFKIYLIDEAHMLSRSSFNVLLKTLEEPPSYIKFLLATTEPKKLPTTILSRCIRFQLNILHAEEIYKKLLIILQKENVSFDVQALRLLSDAADGSMRDALSLTDQAIVTGKGKIDLESIKFMINTFSIEPALTILESLLYFNGNIIMEQLNQYSYNSTNWENLLTNILTLLHQIAINQALPNQLDKIYTNNTDTVYRLQKLSNFLSPSNIQLYYQILLTGKKELPWAPHPRVGIEMVLLRILMLCTHSDIKK